MAVYPKAPTVQKQITPVDEAACVAKIIQCKEDDLPKAKAVGICLAGSDDVQGFERLWKRIDKEVIAARAVKPADHDTVTKFKAAVKVAAPFLDETKWYNGLKAEQGVTSYDQLIAKTTEAIILKEPVAKEL